MDEDTLGVYSTTNRSKTHLYSITRDEYNSSRFTCNMFSTFRRGKHVKTLSFSLYGRNNFYYYKIRDIAKEIRKFYPGWLMRVYHESNVDRSSLCDIECQLGEDGKLLDNTDFCDLSDYKVNFSNGTQLTPAEYILPMMMRFLPVGDSFVDVMMSRDTDSYIIQREIDSVKVWLDSGKLFHIMRDHPQHISPIMGGMWSMRPQVDRALAQKIFHLIVDPAISKRYDPNRQSPWGKIFT